MGDLDGTYYEADREAEDRYFQRIGEGLVSGFTLDKRFLCKDGKSIPPVFGCDR